VLSPGNAWRRREECSQDAAYKHSHLRQIPRRARRSRGRRCPPALYSHLLLPWHCCPAGSPGGGRCFMWGSQPPWADNHQLGGSVPQPPPQGFSPLSIAAVLKRAGGWRRRAKGRPRSPQPAGRRGAELGAGFRPAGAVLFFFVCFKKNNAQQTCRVFSPRCQAILSRSAGLGPPLPCKGIRFGFPLRGRN